MSHSLRHRKYQLPLRRRETRTTLTASPYENFSYNYVHDSFIWKKAFFIGQHRSILTFFQNDYEPGVTEITANLQKH